MRDWLGSLCKGRGQDGLVQAGRKSPERGELGLALSVPQGSTQSDFRRLALAQSNKNVHKETFFFFG